MKKIFLVMVLVLSLVVLAACGGGTTTDEGATTDEGTTDTQTPTEENVTIKISHVEAENDTLERSCQEFATFCAEKSGGTITIESYPNAELGDDDAATQGVALGTIEMALPGTSQLVAYNKDFGIADLPYIFKDEATCFSAFDGDLGNALNAKLEGTGVKNLGYYYIGKRNVSNNVHPINEPADMEGLDIRVMQNPVYISLFETLGANPTPISFAELYTALQQGTVDAEENPASVFYTSKFCEVQKYYSLTGHVLSMGVVIINENLYNGLSDNQKAIIDEGVKTYLVDGQRQMKLDEAADYLAKIEADGTAVNEVSPENIAKFQEAVKPMYEEYKETIDQEMWDLVDQYNNQ